MRVRQPQHEGDAIQKRRERWRLKEDGGGGEGLA